MSRDQQKIITVRVWVHFGLTILTYTCVNFLHKGAPGTTDYSWKWHRAGENAPQTNQNPARHTTAGILWRHRDIPVYPAGTYKQVLPVCPTAAPMFEFFSSGVSYKNLTELLFKPSPSKKNLSKFQSMFQYKMILLIWFSHISPTWRFVDGQISESISPCGSFYHHGLTLIPEWISNHMLSEIWDEIAYLFPNLNRCTEVWGWKSNFTPHFTMDVINCPCRD